MYMEQGSVSTQTVQPVSTKSQRPFWMRYFFVEEVTPENRPLFALQQRAIWIGLALLLLSPTTLDYNWFAHNITPFGALVPILCTLGSFFATWMAFRPDKQHKQEQRQQPTRWQCIILILILGLTIPGAILLGRGIALSFLAPQFSNDGTSLDANAAILLLQGRNPYADSSLIELARHFAIEPDWTTPLRRGQFANRLDYPNMADFRSVLDTALKAGQAPEFESKVSYPALSFLTLVPFIMLGDYNVLPFYILSYIVIVIIAWRTSRPEIRPWVLVLSLANVPMWASAIGGNLDIFYVLLLIVAWLLHEHRWRSAIFFGLALAAKQIAWYFIPLYAILLYRKYGLKEAVYRLAIAGGLGLAINLPFILWNPQAFLAGILAPVADPMFPMGVGIINLSVAHILPYFPSDVYLSLEAIAMLAVFVWYWRICRTCPEAAMLLAVIPLFFTWRSLPSYFYCTAFPLFMLLNTRLWPKEQYAVSTARVFSSSRQNRESMDIATVSV
jgi:hypothetical protein